MDSEYDWMVSDPAVTQARSLSNLPPEDEKGNVEYKLKLVKPTQSRFEHLVTQMKWRIREGKGEAIYEIGVEDNGMLVGLADEDLTESLTTLERMAKRLGATTVEVRRTTVESYNGLNKTACEVLVRRVPDDQQYIDLRLAVLGNVESGKSTLLGVLTQGEKDNGQGRARLNLFRHLHEIESGHTSSVSHEVLGFNSKGEVINYNDSKQGCLTMREICQNASKLITLIDLAGHQKYLKTTIFGLMGCKPDFAMLVVSANNGVAGTTREHLGLAMALQMGIFVVISKIDICPPCVRERTLQQVTRLLSGPGCGKITYPVTSNYAAVTAARRFNSENICPIFMVSNVTGENLDLLKKFLHIIPPACTTGEQTRLMQEITEFHVDEVYSVPHVGKVLGGTLLSGSIQEDSTLLLGPSEEGNFKKVQFQSIHRNRSKCRVVMPGQAATLALGEWEEFPLRKGMVLVREDPTCCMEFEANICVLYHTTSIKKGFQVTVHVGSVCQSAIIEDMINEDSLKVNEQALVKFKFKRQPEFLRVGARLFFREGTTKGMGQITKVYSHNDKGPHIER
ncbi:GTP-binding protein 2-like [Apostichopus japonicus]|uniref:GTP-binding protein 2-like n=1 Tax=Stichopus japonicus TaxID=307972 RepID=UPI003AB8DBF5